MKPIRKETLINMFEDLKEPLRYLSNIKNKAKFSIECYLGTKEEIGMNCVILNIDVKNVYAGWENMKRLAKYEKENLIIREYGYYKMFVLLVVPNDYFESDIMDMIEDKKVSIDKK